MLLEGLHIPLTTPFYADGRLNTLKLEHNVDRYCKTPAAGLVVLSEFGEPTLLSDAETRQTLQSAIEAAAPQKVMIAGVSRDSVACTLELAEAAARLEYDAVLVRCPSILRGSGASRMRAKELLTYFQAVADRSVLPVVLLREEDERGEPLPSEAVIELASHPRIIGAVDAAAGVEWARTVIEGTASIRREVVVTAVFAAVTTRMRVDEGASDGGMIAAESLREGGAALAVAGAKQKMKTRVKAVGFQVLAGRTSGMLDALLAGAAGTVSGFAASAPQACYEVLAAWKDGDEGLAREKQERLVEVVRRAEDEGGVAGIKFGCDLNGYFGGRPRLPLLPLTGRERSEIEHLMQGLRS